MRACELRSKNSEGIFAPHFDLKRYKLIKEVLNGNFPKKQVTKMTSDQLEQFVLNLVKHTCVEVGAKNLSKVKEKPVWWPSDVLIRKPLNKDRKMETKQFRDTLKQLVQNCCNFFKGNNEKWLPPVNTWVNDENFDIDTVKSLKRSVPDESDSEHLRHKSKIIFSKSDPVIYVPNISSNSICCSADTVVSNQTEIYTDISVKEEPPNQIGFLKSFNLGLNNNDCPKPEVANFSRPIKFQNCHNIPLSSDIGKSMIKRENYGVPDYVTNRKLERLEWYVNKEIPRFVEVKYENSYVQNSKENEHFYKFPKRQFCQPRGNLAYQDFIFKLCKPLNVVLKRENLLGLKNKLDSLKVVEISRLSKDILNRHVCKKFKVVLKQSHIQNRNSKRRNLRLRNIIK